MYTLVRLSLILIYSKKDISRRAYEKYNDVFERQTSRTKITNHTSRSKTTMRTWIKMIRSYRVMKLVIFGTLDTSYMIFLRNVEGLHFF